MSEKTEQPTSKRLRDAREEGQVAKSQEIPAMATTAALFAVLFGLWDYFYAALVDLFHIPLKVMNSPFDDIFYPTMLAVLADIARVVLPVVVLVMALGLVCNLAQVGVLVTPKALIPKLENLSPKQWFKKVFSIKGLVEFLKSCIKVVAIAVAVWVAVKNSLIPLQSIPRVGLGGAYAALGALLWDIAVAVVAVMVVIAALDYLFQRWQHNKQLMMSKDEVKREYKEMEGNAEVKAMRKRLHQELLSSGAAQSTRKATVLITNPTHLAIAIYYEEGETPLPIVLAKGEGPTAQRMIAAAKEENIPIMRNVPLARSLYADAQEHAYIPGDLVRPVAEVLRWALALKKDD
ncbi:type III secretion system export apparatus subunit SctU [Desulfocurvus sp.]|jgi:type III secretion protein U|uniref:type III secretion system export apparatus subunit SctU n=1 Tax=Desulfocurvus sp. TaxID=2871698 RepID=UPI0025B9A38E|nr:type III secretion system export apparatus subunit SctU [Desulfocurvus sp.]MCK9239974.1 type III secretion system export apparatus subunit SctU [Desulfocurvus sp.]